MHGDPLPPHSPDLRLEIGHSASRKKCLWPSPIAIPFVFSSHGDGVYIPNCCGGCVTQCRSNSYCASRYLVSDHSVALIPGFLFAAVF